MKKKISAVLIIAICFSLHSFKLLNSKSIYVFSQGSVGFTTKGPLGTIKAESKKLTGTFDTEKRTFSFSMPILSFEGFQNSLQKKHFNEKYMESDKIPQASFKGKIIEEVDFKTPGTYPVRAKGTMTIHGVDKEIIIKSKMTVKADQISIESAFNVLLGDYNIKIPTIVSQQVEDNIAVVVKLDMSPEK
jgi:polyisoprenoid-binding protein YceI